jgi:hypothetical protein
MIAPRKDPERSSVKKILIEHSFSQMDDKGGKKNYSGAMKIGGVLFEYRVTFVRGFRWNNSVEAKRMVERLMFTSEEEVKQVRNEHFGLDMVVNGQSVQLANLEYAFFASHIIPFGEGFLRRIEPRRLEKFKKAVARKKIRVSSEQTVTGAALFTTTAEEVALLREKFSCKI